MVWIFYGECVLVFEGDDRICEINAMFAQNSLSPSLGPTQIPSNDCMYNLCINQVWLLNGDRADE
jgi:hypothetical protein